MQNQVNSQYLPYQQGGQTAGVQPAVQTYPASSVGAVNIQIFNPTANPQGFYQPVPCAQYPCNYNNLMNQAQTCAPQAQNVQASQNQTTGQTPDAAQSNTSLNQNLNNNQNDVASQAQGQNNTTANTANAKNTPKVALTDDYIKTLENYLNSQDNKIRLTGAKELLDRFKEDETRKDDAALTALLNKTLQDPSETVKFVGLTALDAGYATGNNETAQILNQMQASNTSYGEDAALASKILLKMSGNQANAEAGIQQAQTADTASLNMAAAQNQPAETPSLNSNQNTMNAVENKMPPDNTGTLLQGGGSNQMVQPVNNQGA